MNTKQAVAQTFLDIFVIIGNTSLMPEVFTMIVTDEGAEPQYPRDVTHPALPIAGLPVPLAQNLQSQKSGLAGDTRFGAPAIFYLDEGVMLFFRVPIEQETFKSVFSDNYFGPQDFIGGNTIPPFFL